MRSVVVCSILGLVVTVACGTSNGDPATSAGSGASGAVGPSSGAGAGSTMASSTGAGAGIVGQPTPEELFGTMVDTVALEIDYEAGAEPYTGSVVGFGPIWDVTERHLEALFDGANKSFTIPRELSAMQDIGPVAGEEHDGDAIFALVEQHRDRPPFEGTTASFYVLWLDGRLVSGGEVQNGVLGVAWVSAGVIAMFKPVIESAGIDPTGATQRYVEQVTLVHELGHLAGLVNNGLELTSDHQDDEHGAHCDNQDCIMYWTVESTTGAVDYVQKSLTNPDVILWGSECLGDAQAAIAGG